jgi:hypothetical protein
VQQAILDHRHQFRADQQQLAAPGLYAAVMRADVPRRPGWLCLVVLLAACGSSSETPGSVDAGAVDASAQADSSQGDAGCVGETLQELCTRAEYACGEATFTDRCGAQVAGSCGTCTDGICGGSDGEHVCTVSAWRTVEWPSLSQTRIFSMWSAPGSSTVWAGGGAFGAGELWQLEGLEIAILRTPSTILGVHAAGPDVWAVGNRGMVVHGNNGDFRLMPSAALEIYNLNAVWGFGPADIWVTTANGVNSVAHWNGATWTPGMLPSTAAIPACTGFWGSAPDDLWTVCKRGEIFHWNGTAWAKVASSTTQDLNGIYGFAANNIWAVGNNNTLLRWNGSVWSPVTAPSGGGALIGIWGTAANDVYAVGHNALVRGRIIHFDGAAWTEIVSTGSSTSLERIAGAQGRIFVAGFPALLVTFP